MQHQYWVARQTVLRKFGTREDECVVSSDAELDSKLELFKSLVETTGSLQRLVEQAGERTACLSQEETSLGEFMRSASYSPRNSERPLAATSKGIAYCGHARAALRVTFASLHRELDTFRSRGVADTTQTVRAVERARDDYRAALSWMKATSSRLDPDTGRGVHQFRKAQAQVKRSKAHFDKLTLDCLQKVDLLAAARCNMFSHALLNYQKSMTNFVGKALHTLQMTSKEILDTPQYDFVILKGLSQNPSEDAALVDEATKQDQLLFFHGEFKDEKDTKEAPKDDAVEETANTELISIDSSFKNTESTMNTDLVDINLNRDSLEHMPSQLLQESGLNLPNIPRSHDLLAQSNDSSRNETESDTPAETAKMKKLNDQKKERAQWFKLFAELDPLANPDAMPGINANHSHAA